MCAAWGGPGSFLQLSWLDLHRNQLAAALPSTWGSNLNNVTYLDLSQNFLTGTVPAGASPSPPIPPEKKPTKNTHTHPTVVCALTALHARQLLQEGLALLAGSHAVVLVPAAPHSRLAQSRMLSWLLAAGSCCSVGHG